MRSAMSSSITPKPMAAMARPLMDVPEPAWTAVATATQVSSSRSAVQMRDRRPYDELQQHGGLAAAIVLERADDQAGGHEPHHAGVDEIPERIDAGQFVRAGSQVVNVSTTMLPRRAWQ